jgi:hypothetical protein
LLTDTAELFVIILSINQKNFFYFFFKKTLDFINPILYNSKCREHKIPIKKKERNKNGKLKKQT